MLKIKFLKESKLLAESNQGLYEVIGVLPGSLDLFLETFSGSNITFERSVRNYVSSNYQSLIDNLTEEDIPATSARGYKSPLNKIKAQLMAGTTYWWYTIFGLQPAQAIIRFKVVSYYVELEDRLEDIGYGQEGFDFESLEQKDKMIVYEKHFWEDYLDSFFDNHMGNVADLGKVYVGAAGIQSGLYGQMRDWWMSTDGLGIMKSEMRSEKDELYLSMKGEDDPEDAPERKEPQWFEKGVNAWDDGAVGYDRQEDVPRPKED